MRTIISKIALGLPLAILAAVSAQAEDKVVNVYNWSDYIDATILTDFTKETGIKVVYDTYDSNEIVETKLLTGGSGYDVVVSSGPFLARQIQAGVFQKLDKSKLPNLSNMWPDIMSRLAQYDPGNAHAVNYMWGTTGIGYNIDKVKAALGDMPLDSWDVLFKPENAAKLKDCGINIVDSPDEVLPVALNYLGKAPNSKDKADLEAAAAVFAKIRPYVRTFNSSSYINDLANGDICISIGWSGDVLQARNRATEAKNGVKVGYVIPKQGTSVFFDNLAIPADAKHVEEAHAFIDYLMRPEVIARSTNFIQSANGNLASQKFVDDAIVKNPSVYPNEETFKRLFAITPSGPKEQRITTRLWTQMKTGQ